MNILIIFIKNPILGRVKTRLAATVGDAKALDIYLQLCAFTKNITLSIDCQRVIYYSDYIEENDIWKENDFSKKVQHGKDLGERMKNAFEAEFLQAQKVLIIGSDCAELNAEIIKNAFEMLDSQDVVIGPAKDGGYYLLGMNHFIPTLFDNIAWSSENVFTQTISHILTEQKTYSLLPTLSDVDTEEDWKSVEYSIKI